MVPETSERWALRLRLTCGQVECPGFPHVYSPPLLSVVGTAGTELRAVALCPGCLHGAWLRGCGCDPVTEQPLPPPLPDAQGREHGHRWSGTALGPCSNWLWLVKGCRAGTHGNPG